MATTPEERTAKLKQETDLVAARGIQAGPQTESWWWSVAAETRFLIDLLRGAMPEAGAKRASAAAKHAHDFFDTSPKNNTPDGKVDCAKGCSLCCSLYVAATAPEVFLVADFLRREHAERLPEILDRVRQSDRDTRYMDDRRRFAARLPCPLLAADGSCSVYAARPSACRGWVSSSLAACRRGYEGEDIAIPRPEMWRNIRSAHVFAMEAALAANRYSPHHYAFAHALRIALENSDAEERWLKGEDVFAAVEPDSFEKRTPLADRKERVAMLIAAALGQELPE
jgi:hypothetical protein